MYKRQDHPSGRGLKGPRFIIPVVAFKIIENRLNHFCRVCIFSQGSFLGKKLVFFWKFAIHPVLYIRNSTSQLESGFSYLLCHFSGSKYKKSIKIQTINWYGWAMFDLDGFWLYKSQVMKNSTIFLVFLLSSASTILDCGSTRVYCASARFYCASTRLFCASTRLHCGSTRLYCGSTRLYCGSTRLYCCLRRLYCGVRRKLCTKNNCFPRLKI